MKKEWKKERKFERSSCHFFFKESTLLERAPGGSHPLSRGAHRSKKRKTDKIKVGLAKIIMEPRKKAQMVDMY